MLPDSQLVSDTIIYKYIDLDLCSDWTWQVFLGYLAHAGTLSMRQYATNMQITLYDIFCGFCIRKEVSVPFDVISAYDGYLTYGGVPFFNYSHQTVVDSLLVWEVHTVISK
uniref:Integrase_SAM-like_N domain-containing protein n=1 Tax=Heterorhabditis bacteriophora TaxID=37862 RepID=A0A1I7XS10_HETBA